MKLNIVGLIIALIMASLIAWCISLFTDNDTQTMVCGIGTFICLVITLTISLAVKYKFTRSGINIKIIATIFAFIFLLSNFFFALYSSFSVPAYIITNSLLVCFYALSVKSIFTSKM